MRHLWTTFLASCMAVGCATNAQGPSFADAKIAAPPPGAALIYVYRKHAEPTAWGTTIHVNKREAATLNQSGFTWVYAKPGPTQVKAAWSAMSGQKDSSIELQIAAGETYYLEVVGESRVVAANILMYYTKVGSGVNQIEPERGRLTLAACCALQRAPEGVY